MKILLTGTHFTPAVATIEQLKKFKNVEIVYVGRKSTMEGDSSPSVESQVLPKLGVKYISIMAGRLQRSLTFYTIPSLLKIPIGFLQAFFIILSQKPDVILSFGGYVGLPIVLVGWLFSIPIILHEQTLSFGLANKISAIFADKIAMSFDTIKGEKVILTGNPIRHEIIKKSAGVNTNPPGSHSDSRPHFVQDPQGWTKQEPLILIIGGNQGSHAINLVVEGCLKQLLEEGLIYHQTGDSKFKDYERLERLKTGGSLGELERKYTVKKWIGEEYGEVLQKADLVISRAGMNSLTELAALGKPSLLIPLFGREQLKNARFFENAGLAKILVQSKLSAETLLAEVRIMLKNLQHLRQKAQVARYVIILDAGKRLALETVLLGGGQNYVEKKN